MTEEPTRHTGQVPDELAGQRLDQALARMFPDFSRSRLKAWLLDGSVLVDGAEWRPCSLFPGKSVAADGWCSAWVKKAG